MGSAPAVAAGSGARASVPAVPACPPGHGRDGRRGHATDRSHELHDILQVMFLHARLRTARLHTDRRIGRRLTRMSAHVAAPGPRVLRADAWVTPTAPGAAAWITASRSMAPAQGGLTSGLHAPRDLRGHVAGSPAGCLRRSDSKHPMPGPVSRGRLWGQSVGAQGDMGASGTSGTAPATGPVSDCRGELYALLRSHHGVRVTRRRTARRGTRGALLYCAPVTRWGHQAPGCARPAESRPLMPPR
jgi:hypothetical protein